MIRSEFDFLAECQKIHEAYCVRNAIPTERTYTDEVQVPTLGGLILAEAQVASLHLPTEPQS